MAILLIVKALNLFFAAESKYHIKFGSTKGMGHIVLHIPIHSWASVFRCHCSDWDRLVILETNPATEGEAGADDWHTNPTFGKLCLCNDVQKGSEE